LIRLLLQRNVGVEAGNVDTAAAEVLIRSGLAPRCLRILAEPQQQGFEAARSVAVSTMQLLIEALATVPILLHGTGAIAWPLLDDAVERGLQVRIGLEDTLHLPNRELAHSNADLIAEARRRLAQSWRSTRLRSRHAVSDQNSIDDAKDVAR